MLYPLTERGIVYSVEHQICIITHRVSEMQVKFQHVLFGWMQFVQLLRMQLLPCAISCNGNQSGHAPPFIFLLHTGKALKKAAPLSWKEDEM